MRILIFTQHFPPETVATGRRAFDLAESLAERGHQVTVVTGLPNHPSSLGRPYCQRAPRLEVVPPGVRVVRVRVIRSENTRTLNRLLTYGSFVLSAAWAGLRHERPDMILAVSPMPTGLAAMLVHWWNRAPLVFDLQDIWPDSALAVGVFRPGLALRMFRRLECFLYRRCAVVVGITEGFRHYLLKLGVKPERVAVIHNGVDWEMFDTERADQNSRKVDQSDGQFVVGYVGNIGLAQGLNTLLDAAQELLDEPVKFLLVGEGTDKAHLRKLARIRGLTNVEFHDGIPRELVAPTLAVCDALLVMLRRDPLFEITIPSKLYEYMATGKPIICSVGGETSDLVASFQCGLPVKPADGAALAGTVKRLMDDPELRRTLGEKGKYYARELFSRDSLMAEYAALVESLASVERKRFPRFSFPAAKTYPSSKSWRPGSEKLLRMSALVSWLVHR